MKKYILPISILLFAFFSCNQSEKRKIKTDVEFSNYVQAFTSGVVSNRATISVYLSQPVDTKSDFVNLFKFSPEIVGESVLVGDRVFEFRPAEPMKSGTKYSAEFALGKVVNVDKKLEIMPFEFSTVQQSFSVKIDGLNNYANYKSKLMQLSGSVLTADIADAETVEKVLSAKYDSRELPIFWSHNSDGQKHFFVVDSIPRKPSSSGTIEIEWNGKPFDIDIKGEKKLEVPSLDSFKVLDAIVVQQPAQCIHIRFSDPLLKTEDLEGLVELQNSQKVRLEIDGSLLKVWPLQHISGESILNISEGIKSSNYAKLKSNRQIVLQFTNPAPQVRLIGKGVIVPQNSTIEFPFEAISLNAVDVKIIQILKNRVDQFLQNNRLDGDNELKRVGRQLYKGKIDLFSQEPINYNEWNCFKIDLAKFVTLEPGSIYRVEVSFKKEYSLYNCNDNSDNENIKEIEISPKKEAYENEWDSPGWYDSYYYPEGYSWRERENPCDVSYYNSNHFVGRNIFSSHLGIVAKEGRNHRMLFAVTNLVSTNPEKGVELKLYNFQNQLIEKIKTDENGFATVDLSKKPFLLVAQKGKQFGYLRLDDGTALSVSNFDVSGQEITNGMKGFIYGERNVWRPGDTLFLNFILESSISSVENHPITFKLFNPKNQLVERRVVTNNENGFYSLTTTTEKDAPTGNWRAEVQVGNSKFTKRIKVETIKPNRLKIELDLPANNLLSKANKTLPIKASWLHGSPAKLLKAKVEVLFSKSKTVFKKYEKFTFNDPATSFSQREQTIFDKKLDKNGDATIPLKFDGINNAPGILNILFTSYVYENGGDFSTSFTKAKYSPFDSYVGVKMPASEDNWYKTDTDYLPEIVVVDKDGNPVKGNNLEVKLYKINWRWWWESGTENLAHYVSGNYYKPIEKWNINSSKSTEKVKLKVKYRNWQDNGRYFLWVKDKSSGHSTGITFYMSKWGGWRSGSSGEGATILNINCDKEKYNVGDDIQITIPSSKVGRALVSIENGSKVLDMLWLKTNEKQSSFTLKAKPEMAPNFYVNISLIQPYGNIENDAPLRLYGITSIDVENPETILNPIIKTENELKPESQFFVEVSEKSGKKMTYTLAIVDEGLLGLTNYKTPNPHNAFYQNEALGVKTWDLYDYVAGAYGARLEKAFAIGGDGETIFSGKKEVNRFKPVVKFAGPFTLEKGETQKHKFEMPNYVGAVRIMVVAGNQGAYGCEEISVPVRNGLMLLATVPRQLAPSESFDLPVNVFAMKENVKNVTVSVKSNELFEVVGNSEKTIQFDQLGDKMIFFKIDVKGNCGNGKIVVEAQSGKESSSYEVEVQVRNPNLPVVVEKSKLVEANQSWNGVLSCPGEIHSNIAWVEVSGLPPLNLNKYLDFLIQYPHGCVEQITSSVFPQLFLQDFVEISDDQKLETEENIRDALNKLQSYQLPSGGFSYWPGQLYVNHWATNYVGQFLICAENGGYSLPYGLKDKWLRFQKSEARNWKSDQDFTHPFQSKNYDLTQAYRLYTLAFAGNPDLGAMNRLREKSGKSADVCWRLAASYVLVGKKDAAQQLVADLGTEIEEYNEFGGTFGSSLRDKAMILETLILLDEKENAFEMLQNISADMRIRDNLSTQTTAWCLISAARFTEKFYGNDNEIICTVNTNGDKINLLSKKPVLNIPVEKIDNRKVDFDFTNNGDNAAFVRVVAKGTPAGVDTLSFSKNIVMDVKYVDANGNKLNPLSIPQGTDFRMIIIVKHPGKRVDYEDLVLTTLVPSGWEILNNRVGDAPLKSVNFEYQDIRDDRVCTYFDLAMNRQKTFVFYFNAAYKGVFYQPPVSCEAMYDNSVRSQTAGKMVEVK